MASTATSSDPSVRHVVSSVVGPGVMAPTGDLVVLSRPHPKRPRLRAPNETAEDRLGVEAGDAQLVDGPVGADERGSSCIADEPIAGDERFAVGGHLRRQSPAAGRQASCSRPGEMMTTAGSSFPRSNAKPGTACGSSPPSASAGRKAQTQRRPSTRGSRGGSDAPARRRAPRRRLPDEIVAFFHKHTLLLEGPAATRVGFYRERCSNAGWEDQ